MRKSDAVLLALAISIGFSLRLYMAWQAFSTSIDSSTVGLMALRILEGDRPLFIYGQLYMGSLEAYVAALMFKIFGVSATALALSPILFACGWIAAMYLLFRELYGGNQRVAMAAALATALTSLNGLWYTLASYGGYPEYLLMGTLFLWISVRMVFRPLTQRAVWTHATGLGITAALGMWTQMESTVYFITGGVLLAGMLVQQRFPGRLWVPLACATLLGATGFIPEIIENTKIASLEQVSAPLNLLHIPSSMENFMRQFPMHLWAADSGRIHHAVVSALMLIACLYYIGSVFAAKRLPDRLKRLTPLLLCFVFLCLFLPHPVSHVKTPRYLLPLYSMASAAVLSAGFSLPWRILRIAACVPLLVMSCLQIQIALGFTRDKAPEKVALAVETNAIITAARGLGLKHVYVVGNEVDGHHGQIFTFYAHDKIKFLSLFSNRTNSDEVTAECDLRPGFLVHQWHSDRIHAALQSAGIKDYKHTRLQRDLFYDVRPAHYKERSLRPGSLSLRTRGAVEGTAESLFDRYVDSGLTLKRGGETQAVATITVDLGQIANIGGMDIEDFDLGGQMRSFKIEVSTDGKDYSTAQSSYEVLSTYSFGNKVYMLGNSPYWQLRFASVPAQFVRISIGVGESAKRDWNVREIYLLNVEGHISPVNQSEIRAIRSKLDNLRSDRVAADRWLTYQLGFRSYGFSLRGMFPNPNYRFKSTKVDHNLPCRPGIAMVVERALADETQNVLNAKRPRGLALERSDFEHYTVFNWGGKPESPESPTVYWSGLMPLHGSLTK
ncbi:MAG: discoidin domain-containing protein [Verrucomicrobia bacterium]|nr:discoidin domain-containing protein [Verrucomicrobiota bacterium]